MLTVCAITFLILNGIFPSYGGLYKDAKNIVTARQKINEELYVKYNIPPTDYAYTFAAEHFGPSELNRKADIFLQYQLLKKGQCSKKFKNCILEAADVDVLLKDRCDVPKKNLCNNKNPYSELSGACNNLETPNLGMANTPYNRLRSAVYFDRLNEFRRTKDDKELPNPRKMGNIFDKTANFKSATTKNEIGINNVISLMFSQMIAHDTSARKVVTMRGNDANGIRCCNASYDGPLEESERHSACVPISLPENDPFYAGKKIFCQSYVRLQTTLAPVIKTKNGEQTEEEQTGEEQTEEKQPERCNIRRQPENVASSFLDLNTIYSTSEEVLNGLRKRKNGLFKMDRLNILPVDEKGGFTAGDFRFGQTPGLGLIHSLFYRLHNVCAIGLYKVNPTLDDDTLFFEARRITIAIYQHIIYSEWLPQVLSLEILDKYNLKCEESCREYDPTINPSTTTEYAMGAFRFFHTNLPDEVQTTDENGKVFKKMKFSDTYTKVDMLKEEGAYNNWLRGLMQQPQRMNQVGYTGEVRNLFLKRNYKGNDVGVDGMILDVMRGRDSGNQPYIDYYKLCLPKNSKKIKSWEDLKPYFEDAHFKVLRELYTDVNDIELMAGVLLEKRSGNKMGFIGGCVVEDQFRRYRYGDRFFYTNKKKTNPKVGFTQDQLKEIKKISFSRLVCLVARDVQRVPKNGFVVPSKSNPYVECSSFERLNSDPFKQQ